MIAEVYPIQRLPRKMTFFDYRIPEHTTAFRGNLVLITLRGKKTWGVIKRVKKKPERGIKLNEIEYVHQEMHLREDELSFFEWLAFDLAQSVSSVLLGALPTPPKRDGQDKIDLIEGSSRPITLPRDEIHVLTRSVKTLSLQRECIIRLPDLRRMAAVIAGYKTSKPDDKIYVVVPTVRQAKQIAKYLSDFSPVVVTGEESNNERYRRYQQIRSKSTSLCIGTKILALLVDAKTSVFFVVYSSDENHKQNDRNPRIDARTVLWELHDRLQAKICFLDPLPRIMDLWRFPESGKIVWDSSLPVPWIDMRIERQGSQNFFLSHTAEMNIQKCLQEGKKILCVLNRKGVSSGLVCPSCSSRVVCPSCREPLRVFQHVMKCIHCQTSYPILLNCPHCKGDHLKHLSIGIHGFADMLQQLFPYSSVNVLSKNDQAINPDHSILVTTNFFIEHSFDPIEKFDYGLVLLVDADAPLFSQVVNAKERALRQVLNWKSIADTGKAVFLVQTSYPTLFQNLSSNFESFFNDEIELRERYNKPPFSRTILVTNKEPEKKKAELELHHLKQQLESCSSCTVSRQIVNKNGISIRIQIPNQEFKKVHTVFTELPDRYIIDTQGNL